MYVRGYFQDSENGRVVTIDLKCVFFIQTKVFKIVNITSVSRSIHPKAITIDVYHLIYVNLHVHDFKLKPHNI